MLPQRNATLTSIAAAGGVDTWDAAAAGGNAWTGAVDAYFRSRRERTVEGAGTGGAAPASVVVRDELLVEDLPADVEEGQVLTFHVNGETNPRTGKVQAVENRVAPAGVTPTVAPVRITFEVG